MTPASHENHRHIFRDSNPYLGVYAQRLTAQGPGHLDTVLTLRNLLIPGPGRQTESTESTENTAPTVEAASSRSDLPPGSGPQDVRLEGDHTDLLADVVQLALEFHRRTTVEVGPDHPRAMLATCLTAHALAAADQLDGEEGQMEVARVLLEDSLEGFADLAESAPGTIGDGEVLVAETLHSWVINRLEEQED
ncbi:hypothetical protein OG883_35355 [Streptomyces sp. NBC_01142]|uniref:hypothetical protein n=1 Tax=Streptomyces sp. NBC_01142 TaxID=2975865 RepID=UPI0022521D35|nr:hypothetical protein [Streptomyces sp. NBC_01142]MCX4825048.1 hypothetical protein [Streptomyces sp. NBC_01142]